jgi:hypothetical protein
MWGAGITPALRFFLARVAQAERLGVELCHVPPS